MTLSKLFPAPLPVLKPMPAHVRDMRIDVCALAIHMFHASSGPSPNTVSGFAPSRGEKG